MDFFATTQGVVAALVAVPFVMVTTQFILLFGLVFALGAGARLLQSVNAAGAVAYDASPVLVEHLATAVVAVPQAAWGMSVTLLSLPATFALCFTVNGYRMSACEYAPAWDVAMPWTDTPDGFGAWYAAQRARTRALLPAFWAAVVACTCLYCVAMAVDYACSVVRFHRWPASLADWAWPPVREPGARVLATRPPQRKAAAMADSVAARVKRRRAASRLSVPQ